MKNRVQKWGHSLAVRIPRSFAAELGWHESTPVALSLDGGMLVVKTDKERAWDLDALLAGVTGENLHFAWPAGHGEAGRTDGKGEDGARE